MTERRLIASGRTAEVYEWGDSQVLKLFRSGWARADVDREAQVAKAVAAAGLAPAIHDLVRVADRDGIVYERVDGPSMLRQLTQQPWTVVRHGRLLADMHRRMHQCSVPALPSLRARLERRIRFQEAVSATVRQAALCTLERLTDGDCLCHGDLHPDNVILTANGPVIIDWNDATCGNPFADVARTSLLLCSGALLAMPLTRRLLIRLLRRTFHRVYLSRYIGGQPAARQQIAAFALPVAIARLDEGIAEEQAQLLAAIDNLVRKKI